ncbi:MAG: hypothetical protein DMD26_18850 [Gemmatimonadetes bacterium]|nr:MAG: hypothetical protein DMD26_18850 [Gemmatimonadota bacterium]
MALRPRSRASDREISRSRTTLMLRVRRIVVIVATASAFILATSPVARGMPSPTDTLRGVVRDTSGHALPGATVTVLEVGRNATTTSDGAFAIGGMSPARYTILVQRLGYAPFLRSVQLPQASALTIALVPSALRITRVTVTATRTAIDPLSSPLSSEALFGEQLRREHEVSLAHALDKLAGVRTLSTGEQVGKPIIRGLTGPRVLVLDNSLRLEDYSWSDEDGPSVDARVADRIEVIRGPASVLYGSDAVGGVINVVPEELPDARARGAFARGGAEFYLGTNNAAPVEEDNEGGPQRRLADDRVQATTSWIWGGLRMESRSQWQRHSLQEVVGESRAGLAPPIFDLLLNTYSTDLVAHHAPVGRLTGSIGVSGLYQDNKTKGQVPLVPSARTAGGALFAVEQSTVGQWTLLAGMRGDVRHVATDANGDLQRGAQTRNASAVSGDVGAVFRPVAGLAVAGNLGRAFRAPTLFELFTNGPHLGENRFEIGLPNAKPEVSLNADASVRVERGRLHGEVAVYQNRIDNFLYIQATGNTVDVVDPDGGAIVTLDEYRYIQTAHASLRGVDLAVEAEALASLTIRTRFDVVHGTNEQTRTPLPRMPAPRGDVEAELHTVPSAANRAYVGVGTELVAKQDRLGPFDTPTGAYALVHFTAGLTRELVGRPFSLDVRVLNAANTRYRDFLSRYKAFAFGQGRNIVIRLSTGL